MKNEKNNLMDGMHKPLAEVISSNSDSAFRKYQRIFVGQSSIGGLIKYELITILFASFPGAMGYLFRKIFFKPLFKSAGKKSFYRAWNNNT